MPNDSAAAAVPEKPPEEVAAQLLAADRDPLEEMRDAMLGVRDKPMHGDVRFVHNVVCDMLSMLLAQKVRGR